MKNKNQHYIGIDIGATNTKFGIVDNNGCIVLRKNIRSKKNTPFEILEKLSRLINLSKETYHIKGVGIGAAGPVNFKKGIIYYFVNLEGWENFKIAKLLGKKTGLKCTVDNDVNVMGLAENYYGAGKHFKDFVCITLGSGVGGCIIINNKLYRGSDFVAGEIGHIPISLNGPSCRCGSSGCVEVYAGNEYIVKRTVKEFKKNKNKSIIKDLADDDMSKITPKIITEAYKKKDKLAETIWKDTGRFLGIALTGVVNVLNPEAIIIGGGVAGAGKILFDAIKNEINHRAMTIHKKNLKILPAKMQEKSGIIGASLLAKHKT